MREQVGDLIRQEPRTAPGHGVLTVTGLLPSPLETPTRRPKAPSSDTLPRQSR